MPKKDTTPEGLKPYAFHGLDFNISDSEALAECPFCGKEKFSVDIQSGKWNCFTCSQGGNQYNFLERLWEDSSEGTDECAALATERKLEEATLISWGVVKSIITDEWMIPGYNVEGKVRQLYRYVKLRNGKKRLLATPTINHQIHGVNLYNPKKGTVYLCEGPWDAMKLWETLQTHTYSGGKFVELNGHKKSLLHSANVLAVPGCTTFQQSWSDVFLDKKVYVVFDNDYPREHPKTKKKIDPAAEQGVRRFSSMVGTKTAELEYLKWGKGEEYHDQELPDGTDVRDFLGGHSLQDMFKRLCPVPKSWLLSEKQQALQKKSIRTRKCTDWITLANQWRKALKWGEGMDTALSVMLASVVSTELNGDQLWVKIIGPAACGKSTLCEAVSVNKKHVLAVSNMRGFNSGFKSDSSGEEDNSLISRAINKTLVLKDGDTLLQSPNRDQILAEARDLYDGTTRSHYRNKVSRDYENIRMTWILCGTSSLRSIDSSELGERFLDCVIMDGIEDEFEDEVLMRVAERENKNLSIGINKTDEGNDDKQILLAKQMTGGYVQFLRENTEQLMAQTSVDREYLRHITRVGKFVAFMRARPSTKQTENAEREFGTRLVSQHVRLAKCLAAVLNKSTVDDEVMKRVVKVATDTARGVTLNICKLLYEEEEGLEVKTIALLTNQTDNHIRSLLRFLKAIGVVEQRAKRSKGMKAKRKWMLTPNLEELFDEVLGG